jgi:hypothetical protein
MVLISTPSTSKKMVSKGEGNSRLSRFQITGIFMSIDPFSFIIMERRAVTKSIKSV